MPSRVDFAPVLMITPLAVGRARAFTDQQSAVESASNNYR